MASILSTPSYSLALDRLVDAMIVFIRDAPKDGLARLNERLEAADPDIMEIYKATLLLANDVARETRVNHRRPFTELDPNAGLRTHPGNI